MEKITAASRNKRECRCFYRDTLILITTKTTAIIIAAAFQICIRQILY